jgi:hypothetical protein
MPSPQTKPRRIVALLLALGLLFLFLVLASENAFNPLFFQPETASQILTLTVFSAIVFLLFVLLLVLLFRNLLRLYAGQQSRVLGSRLRTRLLVGALILSCAPSVFMFSFSYLLMNRSVDRWFSQPASGLRDDATSAVNEVIQHAAVEAQTRARELASQPAIVAAATSASAATIEARLASVQASYAGGAAGIVVGNQAVTASALPEPIKSTLRQEMLRRADRSSRAGRSTAAHDDEPLRVGNLMFVIGSAALPSEKAGGANVMVAMPLPASLAATIDDIRTGTRDYWALAQARRQVRSTYMLLLLLLTALTLFASSWLALFFSKQITRPIEELADAMDALAEGDYGRRLELVGTEELAALVRSFNDMAADLEDNRLKLEFSSTQLSTVNKSLEERKHELETVLETIPSGVATLDPQLQLIHANRAFYETFAIRQGKSGGSLQSLADVIAEEAIAPIERVIRSSRRMGVASSEIELSTADGRRNVAMTAAPLGGSRDPRGYVLVLDNLTDLLRAQKQVAWKEVAQRVAHEIKNPLTPIGLSAERIRRHVDRGTAGESSAVIRHCSEVISASVESMRVLVNQFAALAQFPAAQPRAADLNAIVESAVATFEGRLDGIRIERHFEADLPPVLADPESLRRALTNLIDNAAEAMHDALHRVLTVETNLATEHSAEVIIADTGTGLTVEIRERLFLPFYSTKQRGTGLGLSIAAKIAQEHGGTLRAEQNQPVGARFIFELPLAHNASAHVGPVAASAEQGQ